jgi:VanZ family protein
MTSLFRFLAWCLAAAVTFATLGPARDRPHAPITHVGEHALAFIMIGLAFGVAYPVYRRLVAGISVIMVGALELLQLLIPGRHARVEDFIIDALATCAGLAFVAVADRRTHSALRNG